mmetsp:Transcript_10390/g.29345  ORF Transcript_10390/g.29345 Transcript_10390/m.29345 type:complete len:230 (+) Transcript_10390:192-881(+)
MNTSTARPDPAAADLSREQAGNAQSLFHEHARHDGHRHQLLKEELARVRNLNTEELGAVAVARGVVAQEGHPLEVGFARQATQLAHVQVVRVAVDEQTVAQKVRRPVRDQTVALHLTKAQTTLPRPTFHRLAREHCHRPARAGVHLVVYHVLEALVKCRPQKDLGAHAPPSVPVVHHLVPAHLVPELVQRLRNRRHVHTLHERGRITLIAGQRRHLGHEALHQVPDRHT